MNAVWMAGSNKEVQTDAENDAHVVLLMLDAQMPLVSP